MPLTYNFTGKVVLITGSGTGMGAAIATLFARSGARVVIADVNPNGMRQVADECARVSPGALKPLQVMVDLRRDVEMERLIQTTITEFGQLDILVNNVGLCYSSHINDDDYIEKQRATFELNVQPMIQLTQLSVDHLLRTKGCIINISSISGVKPVKNISAYCMSKAMVIMFTKCMAVELGGKGIRVNSVCPGYTRTEGANNATGLTGDALNGYYNEVAKRQYPIGRVGEPMDQANAVAYLASSNANFMTGTILNVDGGYLANK